MFKLAHNGNILLDAHEHSPPSAAFIIEALEKSSFCECRVDHDAINNFFKTDMKERTLVVASKLRLVLQVNVLLSEQPFMVYQFNALTQGRQAKHK